jgi:D-glycero-alpha-D-manno-heptose 1-phosphate guanylyltransferase
MEAIFLAGGLGTRLAARLNGVPKPMAPVAGRPFLEILLNQLKRAGCTRAVLSVGHLHAVIEDHFGASFHGMRVEYAIEHAPLGTGGAIRAALGEASEKSVLVLNGDTFLDADYAAMLRFHEAQAAGLTMAIAHRPDVARYGGVLHEGARITGFQEKGRSGPGWINAGAYAMDKDMRWPAHLAERFSFETDFLAPEIARLAPAAYEVDGFFLDIGVPEDLDRAQTELGAFMV